MKIVQKMMLRICVYMKQHCHCEKHWSLSLFNKLLVFCIFSGSISYYIMFIICLINLTLQLIYRFCLLLAKLRIHLVRWRKFVNSFSVTFCSFNFCSLIWRRDRPFLFVEHSLLFCYCPCLGHWFDNWKLQSVTWNDAVAEIAR